MLLRRAFLSSKKGTTPLSSLLIDFSTDAVSLSSPLSRNLSLSLPFVSSPMDTINADVSQKPSNPSKIPIRPQKIRKLSSNPTSTIATTPVVLTAVNSSFMPTLHTSEAKAQQITDSSSSPSAIPIPTTASSSSTTTTTITSTSASTSTAVTSTTVSTPTASTPKNRRRSAVQSARVLPQIIKPLSAEGEINAALHHLRVVDPLLATLIDTHQPPAFESHHSPFLALTKSILYQQLAYKADTSIYNRFVALCGGETAKNADGLLCFLLLCLGCFPDHLSFLRIHQPLTRFSISAAFTNPPSVLSSIGKANFISSTKNSLFSLCSA